MKYLLTLIVLVSALAVLRAQDDEERGKPPTEIPDFGNLDEYIYEPKSTVTIGFRHLSGAKVQFSGGGTINAPEVPLPDRSLTNVNRAYHDGNVNADTRTALRLDSSGNPVIDPSTGVGIQDPIQPDGKTNTWNYTDNSQVTGAPNGYIAFHSYSAEVVDSEIHSEKGRSTNGVDIGVSHDMGTLFNSRATWRIAGGVAVNDISGKKAGLVASNITTLTDYYSYYGHVPPPAPFSSPSTPGSQSVVDTNGNQVTSNGGSAQSVSVDGTVLISSKPDAEQQTVANNNMTAVSDSWKVKGSYYSFRVGPELTFPFSSKFRFTVSAGALLVYSGTTYTVTQTLTPETGVDIVETDSSAEHKVRPGYFADADVQYDLTDKAGFFAGAVFESAGSYTQTLVSPTAHYATKIDLANQNGFRAGMSVRF